MADLAALEQRALSELQACGDEAALRAWNTKYFGKSGEVPQALSQLGKLPPAERKDYGREANRVKESLTKKYDEAIEAAKERELARSLAEDKLGARMLERPRPLPISIGEAVLGRAAVAERH